MYSSLFAYLKTFPILILVGPSDLCTDGSEGVSIAS